jgi:ankyrin repeat protein
MLTLLHLSDDGGLFAVDVDGRERWIPWREAPQVVARFKQSSERLGISESTRVPESLRHRLRSLVGDFPTVDADPPAGAQLNGASSLMAAAFSGYVPFVADLLDAGASVDGRDPVGATALMYACQGGSLEAVETLLRRGADPNVSDHAGSTALMLAAQRGSEDIVRALLGAHADPSARGRNGLRAEDFARLQGWTHLANELAEAVG